MLEPDDLARQARLFASYGAQTVYVTDSAGYMLPHDVAARVGALREALAPEVEVGFHGHHNLAMGVANSLAAIEAGASRIDGSVAGLGAGAGNTPLEVLAAVLERMGARTGIDIHALMAVAEEKVVPLMDQPIRVDRDSLLLGYAGVYSSFLLHAKRASERYGVRAGDILLELGRRRTVGGQEDMIEDVALNLARGGRCE
jgi:4-hydroxy-2-oxovalerate/4-hydroxy-2-oxohexanoate aldolase